MRVTQISAFLENRPGRLLYLLSILGEADINLIAHNIVDASDFGIVHMLLSDPDHALQVIRDAGLTASKTTVLRVSVPDEPGAFVERVLEPLANAKVNIEYSYAYSEGCSGEAMIVLKVDDVAKGESILQEANVE